MRNLVESGRMQVRLPVRLLSALLMTAIAAGCGSGGSSETGSGAGPPAAPSGAYPTALPEQNTVTKTEVVIPMDDGVKLVASEFMPDVPEKVPTVVSFYPYGRNADVAGDHFSFPAEFGYGKLTVDVRGTGASEGAWTIYGERELQDYVEVIRWAVTRPYNNGSVVLMGVSSGAISALLAAQQPGIEAVKAVFARTSNADTFRDLTTSGGEGNPVFLAAWSLGLIGGPSFYQPVLSGQYSGPQVVLNAESQHLLGTGPYLVGGNIGPQFGSYQGMLPAQVQTIPDGAYDSPWYRERSPLTHIDRIKVPTMLLGANFDLFQRAQPLLYAALPLPSTQKKLVMVGGWHFFGPNWLSSDDGTRLVKDDRGNILPSDKVLRLAWFDRWAKGIQNNIESLPTVEQSYFGEGYRAQATPLPPRRAVHYRLGGGGELTSAQPAGSGQGQMPFQFISGVCSQNPVQNIGGQFLPDGEDIQTPCTTDNRVNELDGLAFTTAPVERATTFAGPANLRLWVSSTRPDTNVVGFVTDVAPDGTSRQISYGALVGSHRKLIEAPCTTAVVMDCSVYLDGELIQPWHPYTRAAQEDMAAGEIYRFDIEILPLFVVLQPGHSLRLTLKTSDFPKAMPSFSTLANAVGGVTTVYYDPEHPAALIVGQVIE
ncbi:MAG: CocE/NonD family hydrolase [Nevskiales bacterium]